MSGAQTSYDSRGPRLATPGYPPATGYPQYAANSTSTVETKVAEDPRRISRTPSPTPSEARELQTGAIDWKTLRKPGFWFRKEWFWFYVIFILIAVLVSLITIFHTQIVDKLTPVTKWLHDLKFGWLVPIGVLFVISFPPLFGHEIVAILCGLVWGLWVGFGIVAAGTFLGEVGNFYSFKYCFRSRGEKMERTKLWYACLSRVVRDGGFKVALIARLSVIPGHFTTAIFATCGMNIIVFSMAAILSLPKQFITVYLGVILAESKSGVEDKKSKIISDSVLAVTFIVTIVACWYILSRMDRAKPLVIYDRRKARQHKLAQGSSPYANEASATSSTEVFNPHISDSEIPLTANMHMPLQQWDQNGKAMGYAPDPNLYTPTPRTGNAAFLPLKPSRDVEEGGSRLGGYSNLHDREESAETVGWDNDTSYIPPSYPGQRAPTHAQPPPNMTNPYSPEAHRNRFNPTYPEIGQTPTQATFMNNDRHNAGAGAASGHVAVEEPRSPFDHEDDEDEAYGGYVPQGAGHYQEPTNATFQTAYSSSPTEFVDPRVSSGSPQLPQGAYQPGTRSPQPPTSLR